MIVAHLPLYTHLTGPASPETPDAALHFPHNGCMATHQSKPWSEHALFEKAVKLHGTGQVREAFNTYQEILADDPTHAGALHFTGLIAFQSGEQNHGVQLIEKALAEDPSYAMAWFNLGAIRRAQGNAVAAIACFEKAGAAEPGYADAHWAHAELLVQCSKGAQAVDPLRKLVACQPEHPVAWALLGDVLRESGRGEEAFEPYNKALELNPDQPMVHACMATIHEEKAHYGEALKHYKQALDMDASLVQVAINLAILYKEQAMLDEALAVCRLAMAHHPAHAALFSVFIMGLTYHMEATNKSVYEETRAWVERVWPTACKKNGKAPDVAPHNNPSAKGRKLKIGYVSGDFSGHPVGNAMVGLFPAHDRENIEVICYDNGSPHDEIHKLLRKTADQWIEIKNMDDATAAARIRGDGIDVLVDLSGYTGRNRLGVFALKPAPVQLTWLGYFATTGLDTMDYIISDERLLPPDNQPFYSEKFWHMPAGYICFQPPDFEVPLDEPPFETNGYITFGCFNTRLKLNRKLIDTWGKILAQVPERRLMLKYRQYESREVQEDILKRFKACGIEKERILFEGRAPRNELLAAYNKVDIALDPFPFNGGTTTLEALWMSVPVICLNGDKYVCRAGADFAQMLNHPEFIGASVDDYVTKAVVLAHDRAHLSKIRRTLRGEFLASPLADVPRFARDLEKAYREMFQLWHKKN